MRRTFFSEHRHAINASHRSGTVPVEDQKMTVQTEQTVRVASDLASKINEKVATGNYADADAVIREAMDLLEERDRNHEWLLAALADGERGPFHEFTPDRMAQIRRRARERRMKPRDDRDHRIMAEVDRVGPGAEIRRGPALEHERVQAGEDIGSPDAGTLQAGKDDHPDQEWAEFRDRKEHQSERDGEAEPARVFECRRRKREPAADACGEIAGRGG